MSFQQDRERVLRLLFAKINSIQGFLESSVSHSPIKPPEPTTFFATELHGEDGPSMSLNGYPFRTSTASPRERYLH